MLWNGDGRSSSEGRPGKAPDTLEKVISYLEQSFPVNYDARYSSDLLDSEDITSMSSKNHHLMSLAHSPDIIGLLFSIIDQLQERHPLLMMVNLYDWFRLKIREIIK